jgi:hypothetical protein
MQDAFLPLKGFLGSHLARWEKDFSFNWIAQEENLGLLSDLTENDNCRRLHLNRRAAHLEADFAFKS